MQQSQINAYSSFDNKNHVRNKGCSFLAHVTYCTDTQSEKSVFLFISNKKGDAGNIHVLGGHNFHPRSNYLGSNPLQQHAPGGGEYRSTCPGGGYLSTCPRGGIYINMPPGWGGYTIYQGFLFRFMLVHSSLHGEVMPVPG